MEHQAPGQRTLIDIDLAPPSYDNVSSAGSTFDESIETEWDKQCPPNWETQRWNFGMIIDPGTPSIDWEARFLIHAKNLPRLMRQGFHWSVANVKRGDGYMLIGKEDVRGEFPKMGNWKNARVYFLKDLSEPAQWFARLIVLSDKIPILSEFRLENLRANQVRWSEAFNWNGKYIYCYNYCQNSNSDEGFNTIYDNMSLNGWWSWPTKKVEQDPNRKE